MKNALLALAAALPLASSADDFASYDFALRFPTAISHLSPFGEVAGKSGAAAASVWGSSPNPASVSWGFQGNPCAYPNYKDPNHAVSAQYTKAKVRFQS